MIPAKQYRPSFRRSSSRQEKKDLKSSGWINYLNWNLMCRRIILFLLLIPGFVQAQYPGYKILTDANDFKTKFTAASQKTNTIKSDFVQEKELSMLSEKIVSRGKFWFKRENAVRMEYTTPFQYLMIIN